MDLLDTARVGLLVLVAWFAASLLIAAFWGVAGYRLNRRRELATIALLETREVSIPTQTRAVVTPAPGDTPAIPAHASKRRRRQGALEASA